MTDSAEQVGSVSGQWESAGVQGLMTINEQTDSVRILGQPVCE